MGHVEESKTLRERRPLPVQVQLISRDGGTRDDGRTVWPEYSASVTITDGELKGQRISFRQSTSTGEGIREMFVQPDDIGRIIGVLSDIREQLSEEGVW